MPLNQVKNKSSFHQALQAPFLTDEFHYGLPRYWVNVHSIVNSRDLADSTEKKRLQRVEALYVFADNLRYQGFLDDALSKCDLDELAPVLEAYFISLKNRPKLTESSENQWRTGISFVVEIVTRISKSCSTMNGLEQINAKLLHLQYLYGQLRIHKSRQPETLRSLPSEVVSYLYEVLDPLSSDNPFARTQTKWTMFIAFVILLHQGLRRSEVLMLPVNAVKSGLDNRQLKEKYWLNIQENSEHKNVDPRSNKPNIKTANSVRQVPVSHLTSKLIQIYTDNYRGKVNHPFLLSSQWKTPFSSEALTANFSLVSKKIPPAIRKILHDRNGVQKIVPHSLRHTCAVVRLNQFLEQGDSMDLALQKMRQLFGWSRTSDMPQKYAKAVFEDRLANVWTNITDDRIELLRALPEGL